MTQTLSSLDECKAEILERIKGVETCDTTADHTFGLSRTDPWGDGTLSDPAFYALVRRGDGDDTFKLTGSIEEFVADTEDLYAGYEDRLVEDATKLLGAVQEMVERAKLKVAAWD